jgi:CysZ protein
MLEGSRNEASNSLACGVRYFFDGVRLVLRPELRKYIVIPLIINCIIFITCHSVF